MATVNKNFKVKHGLVVEGTTGTINGDNILTESQDSQDFILDLIGGETLVKSVGTNLSVDGAGELSLDLVGIVEDVAGTRLTTDGSTLNVDVDGIADDLTGSYDFATNADITTAVGTESTNRNDAIAAAVTDLEAYADQAEVDAKAYTDTRETAITTAYQSYADTAEADAISAAAADATTKANAAQAAAEATASADATTKANAAQAAAELHADTAIANLVDSAPATLDTLNELAAALQDNPDVIGDLQDIAAGKQDTLTAGDNIDITGATISVTGLVAADISDFGSASQTANIGYYDPAGSAQTAEDNAIAHADGLAVNYDAAGTAQGIVDALDTDDIEEGVTNQYFTDTRAKISAADLITNAIKTNITITGDENGLTITAENGVADSSTSDLAEGTNQYFTEGRAKDAVAAALGDGIEYQSGSFNVQIATGLVLGGGTGNEIEIDRETVDTWYDAAGSAATAQTAAEDYADGLAGNYEVAGAAAAAQAAAESYADGLAVNYDAAGSASTAESNANSYTDSLIGDNTVDGTSGNTVTARIASAVSNLVDSAPETLDTLNELAAALQDNPDIISDLQDIAAGKQDTLTAGANIDITGATISVTGLDTDDVSEGTNLYFTDARAVDALEAVVPNFTEVDINSVATQVAATGSATAATETTIYSFAKADYRSAKFLVKVAYSTHTEISEVLLTLDTSDNIAITEYAIVGTNGTLSAVSAAVSGANVNLLVTPTNTSTVTVMGTLLA
jgi:hypothetical protein